MHESRAVAEILRAAELAAGDRRLRRLDLRIEGDEHLTPDLVRTHLMALAARSHPDLEVIVEVDLTTAEPGIRLLSIGTD